VFESLRELSFWFFSFFFFVSIEKKKIKYSLTCAC